MVRLDIAGTTASDMTNIVKDITIAARNTDAAGNQDETEWINQKWSTYFGIYKTIPEVKTAIDMRAIWTLGGGFKADPEATVILDHISGWGNDTFNSILKNMIIVKRVGGDAFCEVMRADNEQKTLVNLKPLDPGSIKIIVDKKGILKRYEQINKTGNNKVFQTFQPDEIFHLVNKRVGDEIHGVSDIEAIEEIVKATNESFADMKQIMHRYIKPIRHFELDTDDQTKIDQFIQKVDALHNKGEDLYTPMGVSKFNLISVPPNATLNGLPWREHLRNYFYQVVGIPQIVLGNAAEFSESSAKIAYLAFEQSVEDEQNDIEAQVWNQLGLRIELSFPASLRNELLSDESKDGQTKQMTAEMNPAGMEE